VSIFSQKLGFNPGYTKDPAKRNKFKKGENINRETVKKKEEKDN
jgi:hypothetical protein